jgi:hypothetical protein
MTTESEPSDIDGWVAVPRPARTTPRHGGSVVMAAMIGLAEALGWDREEAQTEMSQPADTDRPDDLKLDFGDLESLDS